MSDISPNDNGNAQAPRRNGRRRKLVGGVLAVFILAGLGYAAWWILVGSQEQYTDNAYVDGNIVQITPQVAGTIIAIGADNTDAVKAGQVLVRLDPADATVALEEAEANLAKTVRQVRNLFAVSSGQQANVKQRESEVARAKQDVERREKLAASGAVSGEEMNHARDALAAAEAALAAAREQSAANRALVDQTTVEDHPDVRNAAAKVREAYLAYTRTRLPSPVAGVVSKRSVQLGQRVNPGTPLMAVIPVEQMWVNANFKEPQIADIHIGQKVKLRADVYGGKVEYDGTVVGLDAGTGSAFSMLPAQNATGNWIKVVQRVPVRVAIDPEQLKKNPLRIGLSMEATVDIHDRSGPVLATAPRSGPAYSTPVFDTDQHDAKELIDRIVRTNANGADPAQHLAGTRPHAGFHPASFTVRAAR
ncbi:MAG TPA: HlyD family efflux transporter periplasmic adaptor subunit [Usitatibacter sp.]|jgi:membrane fusion protein (multidrug efflux system)|nr:HlyD family efflux transporter periplasmic adaptor subunit [Usitatibacter sp.]